MTANDPDVHSHDSHDSASHDEAPSARRGHGWMMLVCCIPVVAIAVALAIVGVLSVGFLVFAIACTSMMALMMVGMSRDGHEH